VDFDKNCNYWNSDYLVAVFLGAGFLAVVVFLVAAGFFVEVVAGFLAGARVGVVFLTVLVTLTPAALAILAISALRLDAVFFLSRPFLTALSYCD